MKFSFPKNRFLIIALSVVFVFSLNLFHAPLRAFFYSFSSPMQSFLWDKGRGLSDFLEGFLEAPYLKSENKKLKEDVLFLRAEIAELQDLKDENRRLREALNLGIGKDFTVLQADIISKDIPQDALIVSKGKNEGLEPGMPVITENRVLAGRISEVFNSVSRVALLSNPDISFDVKIENSKATGLWRGQGRGEALLDLVSKEIPLVSGDSMLTSTLGGVFPENLLVGKIEEVANDDAAPFQSAAVSPFFRAQDSEFLLVITSFKK